MVVEHLRRVVGHSQDLFGCPKVVSMVYSIVWKRPDLNLKELAKLRWIHKWLVARLAAHFGRKLNTVQGYLCQIRKSGEWHTFGLSVGER